MNIFNYNEYQEMRTQKFFFVFNNECIKDIYNSESISKATTIERLFDMIDFFANAQKYSHKIPIVVLPKKIHSLYSVKEKNLIHLLIIKKIKFITLTIPKDCRSFDDLVTRNSNQFTEYTSAITDCYEVLQQLHSNWSISY